MNRAKKVSRLWLTQRPIATHFAEARRKRRNQKRKPKPQRDPGKV